MEEQLLGKWVSDPEDKEGRREFGTVTLEFGENGELTYSIRGHQKEQRMFLTYAVEDGMIVTDQPSQPHKERTAYSLTSDGRLTLWFGGQRSVYVRGR
jgi:hypothetical protein